MLAWLTALSCYDLSQRRLPNALTLSGAAAILPAATVCGRGPQAFAGAVALTAVYLLVHLAAPRAMGAGDVKLAIGVGGLTGGFGPEVWFLAAIAAPLLTALMGGRAGPGCAHGPARTIDVSGYGSRHPLRLILRSWRPHSNVFAADAGSTA